MRTLYIALGISGLLAVALAVSFYLGADWYRDARALDDARDYIEGTEDARDATSDLPTNDDGALRWLHEYINGR